MAPLFTYFVQSIMHYYNRQNSPKIVKDKPLASKLSLHGTQPLNTSLSYLYLSTHTVCDTVKSCHGVHLYNYCLQFWWHTDTCSMSQGSSYVHLHTLALNLAGGHKMREGGGIAVDPKYMYGKTLHIPHAQHVHVTINTSRWLFFFTGTNVYTEHKTSC
jgi:hypothetical protein